MVKFLEVTDALNGKRRLLNVNHITAIQPGSYVYLKDAKYGNEVLTYVDSGCSIFTTDMTAWKSDGWSVKESYEDLWKAITAMQLR